MARYPTISGTLAGDSDAIDTVNCLSPEALFQFAQQNLFAVDFRNRANSYRCPLGPTAGQAWVLLLRRHLDAFDRNGWFTLQWVDGNPANPALVVQNLTIVKSYGQVQAVAGEKDAVRLVLLEDRRRLMAMSSINAQYNVRIPAPSATSGTGLYYTDSLDSGSLWTWQTLLNDVWTNFPAGIRGTAPTLPYTPDPDPQGWRFIGVNAWDALHQVLEKIGCTTAFDPTDGTFSYVQLGQTQDGLAANLTTASVQEIFDYDAEQDYHLAHVPETVRVFFFRREQYHGIEKDTPDSSNWEMSPAVSKDYTTGVTGALAGSVLTLWDDLPALFDDSGSNSNSSALQTRADELGENLVNKIQVSDERMRRFFGGIVTNLLTGSEVTQTTWRDYGDQTGTVTEVLRRPIEEIEHRSIVQSGVQSDIEQFIEQLKTPDFSRNQYPVYPRVSQFVQVDDGSSSTGDLLTANGDGLFDGFVVRYTGGTWTQLEACWIRPTDLEGTSETAVSKLRQKDRFHARLSGIETSGGTTLPVYLPRKGASSDTENVRWFRAKQNWTQNYTSDQGAHSVVCNPCDNHLGDNTDTGTDVTVLLPGGVTGVFKQDPNVVTDDVIGAALDVNGSYTCVTDYLDDKVGTVKLFNLTPADIPSGWAQMNGADNSVANGGSGIDMTGKFSRHPEGIVAGGAGGAAEHNHTIDVEIEAHSGAQIAQVLQFIEGAFAVQIDDHTIADLDHDHQIEQDTPSNGWSAFADQKPPKLCTTGPIEPNTSCAGGPWGPLRHTGVIIVDPNVVGGGAGAAALQHSVADAFVEPAPNIPPYVDLFYIERLRNSENAP